MPHPARGATTKRLKRRRFPPSRRPSIRRAEHPSPSHRIIIGLLVGAFSLSLAIIGQHLLISPKPRVLGAQTPPLPTSINPNFLSQVDQCFLPVATAYGYHLYITAGFRTTQEQDKLYAQGRTAPGDIITSAPGGKSLHNFGYAIDVADRFYAYDIDWNRLQKIGAYCGLEEGDRGYVDLPHFQYRGGLSLEQFTAGQRPKPLTLPCSLLQTRYLNHQQLTANDLRRCHASGL